MRDNGLRIPVTGIAAFADRPRAVEPSLREQEVEIIGRFMQRIITLQRRASVVAREVVALRHKAEAEELEDRLLGNMIDVLGR